MNKLTLLYIVVGLTCFVQSLCIVALNTRLVKAESDAAGAVALSQAAIGASYRLEKSLNKHNPAPITTTDSNNCHYPTSSGSDEWKGWNK